MFRWFCIGIGIVMDVSDIVLYLKEWVLYWKFF